MSAIITGLLLAQAFAPFAGTGSSGAPPAVRPATVAFYGDSIAQGECSGTPPPVALDGLLPSGYTVANKGVSGETAHQIATRVVASASTACIGEPCGTYVLQGGVNTLKHAAFDSSATAAVADVALNGDGGSDGAHDLGMLDAADHIRNAHPTARLLLLGVLPYGGCTICGTNPNPGPRAAAYNAALLNACASRAWLTCLVPYEAFEDPASADRLRPEYACGDMIHLVNAGSAALAQTVYDGATW